MNEYRENGKVKSIGVSNFTERHLSAAFETGIPVVNNQVELHPTFNQKKLQNFCDEHKVVLTAYAPLGRGRDMQVEIVEQLAQKYSVSVPQITLNWITRRGVVAIPKASSREHLEDNLRSQDFEMEEADHELMWQIPQAPRAFIPDWAEFEE
jgi:diketogulonate reductase-like aldo/keto reductase